VEVEGEETLLFLVDDDDRLIKRHRLGGKLVGPYIRCPRTMGKWW
jgi:hypothetical protein